MDTATNIVYALLGIVIMGLPMLIPYYFVFRLLMLAKQLIGREIKLVGILSILLVLVVYSANVFVVFWMIYIHVDLVSSNGEFNAAGGVILFLENYIGTPVLLLLWFMLKKFTQIDSE